MLVYHYRVVMRETTLSNGEMGEFDACFPDDDACRRILLEHEREREGKLRDIAASLTQPRVRRSIKPRTSEPTRDVVDAANAAYQDKFVSRWNFEKYMKHGNGEILN